MSTVIGSLRPRVGGIAVSLGLIVALSVAMVALRSHLAVATVGLVLVLPVLAAVILGGTAVGAVAVVAGFLVYDLVFIPPYYTLTVGAAQNWVVLVVYVIVASLVGRVVDRLRTAQAEARAGEADTQKLVALSQLLIGERPLADLLELVVAVVRADFGAEGVVILLPHEENLVVAAASGRELSAEELRQVSPKPGVPSRLGQGASTASSTSGSRTTSPTTEMFVLVSTGRPVGLIGLAGVRLDDSGRLLATAFANHIAVAVERTQLQEQVVRMHVLEQVDRLRRALMGAVSHDLRTPLATIKTSASVLRDPGVTMPEPDRRELLSLIEAQADRLARLVTNLLDVGRIEAGTLVLDRQQLDVRELIEEAVGNLGLASVDRHVVVDLPGDLPPVDADHLLISQVLVNLLENALRYAPQGTEVTVAARVSPATGETVEISVSDDGPGIAKENRRRVFELFRPTATSGEARPGGSGLGLAIANAFVEAHGGRIWVETAAAGGAKVCISLPAPHDTAPFSAEANDSAAS